jgi:hypothetical protein
MSLETYTLNNSITIFCSVGFGMVFTALIVWWSNKKKISAETTLFNTEIYSTMLGDLRAQINMQGDQIKNQAEQILALQKKDVENSKIITLHQRREREYQKEIKELRTTIREMEIKLANLQNQISNE